MNQGVCEGNGFHVDEASSICGKMGLMWMRQVVFEGKWVSCQL